MNYDVNYFLNRARITPGWTQRFTVAAGPVDITRRKSFRNVPALAEFLRERKGGEFTSPMVMDYFMARGWRATRPKQNAATFLTNLARKGKMIRVVGGNARSKRYAEIKPKKGAKPQKD